MPRPALCTAFALVLLPLLVGCGQAVPPAPAKAPDRVRVGLLGIQLGKDTTIVAVVPGGAAEAAGLAAQDVVLSVDGKELESGDALRAVVKSAPDRALALKVRRGGREMDVRAAPRGTLVDAPEVQQEYQRISLQTKPDEAPAAVAERFRSFAAAHPGTDLGAMAGMVSLRYAAQAAKEAGDEAMALSYADALQKDFPDGAAAREAGDLAYEIRVLGKGKPAPDFHAPTLDGKGEISLSALKGKPVLVDAWASWCGPCKAALPTLKAIQAEYAPKGLQVVSLSLDEPRTKEKAVEEVAKQGLSWPQGWDQEAFGGAYAKAYKVNAIPNYLLVDAQGRIAGHWVGFDEEGIRKALAGLLPQR